MNDLTTDLAAGLGAAAAFEADDFGSGIAFALGSAFLSTTPRSDAFRFDFGMLPTEQFRDGLEIAAASIGEYLGQAPDPRGPARVRTWL